LIELEHTQSKSPAVTGLLRGDGIGNWGPVPGLCQCTASSKPKRRSVGAGDVRRSIETNLSSTAPTKCRRAKPTLMSRSPMQRMSGSPKTHGSVIPNFRMSRMGAAKNCIRSPLDPRTAHTHIANSASGSGESGSQSYVPPAEKDDRALKEALDLLRGTTTDSAFPPNPKAAVPN
jgi:hypothetical protein